MNKKTVVYLTSFFCGMSVMAVELSASRLLAPYFGTSSIIWTIIIGLIMISLSIGNVLGGRLADKYRSLDRLYAIIWISSLWIALIPFTGKYVITLSVLALMWLLPKGLLTAGSAISCLVIFSVPMVMLGMASPWLVRIGLDDMDSSGRTTGRIYAVNTIGSIIGTFVPTFVTIPVIGTGKTFLTFALLLNLICISYLILQKKKFIHTAVSGMVILVLLVLPLSDSYAFWRDDIVYEGESLYNYVQVSEDDEAVYLSTNVAFGVQSVYPKTGVLTGYYYDYALMAPFFMKDFSADRELDVLVLGLGTGTFAKQCKKFFPNTRTDGVEIDPTIARLSKKYFGLTDEEAGIFVTDGRTFLKSPDARMYDVVMIDAYHDITFPFHMSTTEFFSEVKSRLKPGGVVVMNINMRSQKGNDITTWLCSTVRNNWNYVFRYDVKDSTNTIVFATDEADCLRWFSENAANLSDGHVLSEIAENVFGEMTAVEKTGGIFTDDLAPVELMGQQVLDEIINYTINEYKDLIKKTGKGIRGIFDLL